MGVVNPAPLLQCFPDTAAAAGGIYQLLVNDCPVQDVFLVNHQDVGNFAGPFDVGKIDKFVCRDHLLAPGRPRRQGEVAVKPRITGDKVDQRKGGVAAFTVVAHFLKSESMGRPVRRHLRVAIQAEPGRLPRIPGRVVYEARKRP